MSIQKTRAGGSERDVLREPGRSPGTWPGTPFDDSSSIEGASVMRNRAIWAMTALLIGLVASGSSPAQQVVNLVTNGGFETGVLTPWGGYANSPGVRTQAVVQDCVGADVPEGPIEGRYCLDINVTALGANNYAIGIQPRPTITFQSGKKYTFAVFLK